MSGIPPASPAGAARLIDSAGLRAVDGAHPLFWPFTWRARNPGDPHPPPRVVVGPEAPEGSVSAVPDDGMSPALAAALAGLSKTFEPGCVRGLRVFASGEDRVAPPDTPRLAAELFDAVQAHVWARDVEGGRRAVAEDRHGGGAQTFLFRLRTDSKGVLSLRASIAAGCLVWPMRKDAAFRRAVRKAAARWRASSPEWFRGVRSGLFEIEFVFQEPSAHELLDALRRSGRRRIEPK